MGDAPKGTRRTSVKGGARGIKGAGGLGTKGIPAVNAQSSKPKWMVENEEAARSHISDEQLARAKEAFFRIDKDGSGSIDKEELGFMLKSLGQNPTDEDLDNMMKDADSHSGSGDSSEGNGKIEMREFLKWYGKIYNAARNMDDEEIWDAFVALGGGDGTAVTKDKIHETIMNMYELDVDVDDVFCTQSSGPEMKYSDFQKEMLHKNSSK